MGAPAAATSPRGVGVPASVGMLGATAFGLAAGGAAAAAGALPAAHGVWAATTALAVVPAGWWVVSAVRQRRLGVDVLALLALIGALAVSEFLAGAVIALMLATGRALEGWASGRAERELRRLVERAPNSAHVRRGDVLVDLAVGDVAVGDLIVVKPGEVVPVDGRVEGDDTAVIDESALTGEAVPVERVAGDAVRSGTVNVGGPVDLRATTTAAESTYAGLVALVAAAQAESAPAVRLADRYAFWFVTLSLAIAGGAAGASGQLSRAVAVLVVATPCPLILAVPVALVAGLSRAAKRGVVIKGGGPLERLATAKVLLFDKTGTLTEGRPVLVGVVTTGAATAEYVLRLAASLDQVSPHVLAAGVVHAARAQGLPLSLPVAVEEVAGHGVRGVVDGHAVALGKASWVGPTDVPVLRAARRRADREGQVTVFVGIDGAAAGILLFQDRVRTDAARTIRRLREDGVSRIVMVTGDRAEVAETVGAVIGVDEVLPERTPVEKLDAVAAARLMGPTIMVGDGINDAPALALADVGVAMAARGATASSEAADVVLTVDRLDRLGEAVVIARRSLRIAVESVTVGIGLSLVAMAVAAAGRLPATWGAIAQEAIDLTVILNALRAVGPGRSYRQLETADAEVARRFSAQHRVLRPDIDAVRDAADAIGAVPDRQAVAGAAKVHRLLVEELWPHEQAEDAELYPMLARVLGGTDRTATMSRAHVEIAHLIRRLGRLLDDIGTTPVAEDLIELRRLLYGLHAVLQLHFAQEDESYLSLADDEIDAAS